MEVTIGLAAAKSGKGIPSSGMMDGKKDIGASKVAGIVARLFADRTYSHMAHLKTSSFAAHKALNEFYDEVIELADDLAEMAQGKYGKLSIPVGQVSSDLSNAADVLEASIADTLKDAESCCEGALENKIDEIEGLYLGIIYKLRELH